MPTGGVRSSLVGIVNTLAAPFRQRSQTGPQRDPSGGRGAPIQSPSANWNPTLGTTGNIAQFANVFQPGGLYSPGYPLEPTDYQNLRRWGFPVGWNYSFTPRSYEAIGFEDLKFLAKEDITALCIETRKDQIEKLEWHIKPRDEKNPKSDADKRADALEDLFAYPDGHTPFATWLRELIHDVLVLDAPAIELRRNRGGDIIGLDIVAGETIKVLIDETGRRPRPPAPAYEQIIHGRPWVLLEDGARENTDEGEVVAQFTDQQLVYFPRNPRSSHAYGYSPVESIWLTINTSLRRGISQLQYFTESNIPLGGLSAHEAWCYSEDTEVLTKRGWRRFAEVSVEIDEFATRHCITRQFQWQKAEGINICHFSGDMVAIKSRTIDCLVNPPHRVLISDREEHETIVLAGELLERHHAEQRIPVTSSWAGQEIIEKKFIQETNRWGGRDLVITGKQFCAFMGAWLADGYTNARCAFIAKSESGRAYGPYLDMLFDIIGTTPSRSKGAFVLSNAALARYLHQFKTASAKHIPDEIMEATPEQIETFLHFFSLGDGSADGTTLYTSSPRMADQLQELVQKIGLSATISKDDRRGRVIELADHNVYTNHINYRINISQTKTRRFSVEAVPYNGSIGCVSVPNGILYVRRNGKPCWSGNTPEQIKQFQEWLDSKLAGNTAERSRLIVLPSDAKMTPFKEPPLKDDFDEWRARIICFAFSLPPTAFTRQTNRATAESAQEAALEEGLAPLMGWVKRLFDGLIQRKMGHRDLEFSWSDVRPVDPGEQSKIHETYIKTGVATINEARDELGLDPIEGGDEAMVYLPTGPILVRDIEQMSALAANPPPPPAPIVHMPGAMPGEPPKPNGQAGNVQHPLNPQARGRGANGSPAPASQDQATTPAAKATDTEVEKANRRPFLGAPKRSKAVDAATARLQRKLRVFFAERARDVAAQLAREMKLEGWEKLQKYSDDQPRDERGRWEGGGGTTESATPASDLFQRETDHSATLESVMAQVPESTREKIDAAKERLASVVPTDAPVSEGGFKNPDGTWTAEREALHQEIIGKMLTPEAVDAARPAAGEQPTYTMLGGRAGSGKSWLTSENGPVDAHHALVLDSDRIKGMLPEYQGWNAAQVHEESSHIFSLVDNTARSLGVNVVHDSTMRSSGSAEQFAKAYSDAGYKTEGYYMFLPPEVATVRAASRFAGPTGRFVPPEYVFSSRTNEASFDKVKSGYSKWAVYNNNVPRGSSPRQVANS